jgi:integrase
MDHTPGSQVAVPVNDNGFVQRVNERLGSVRLRHPDTGKRAPLPVERTTLLQAACTHQTFTAALAWLMNERIPSVNTARSYADDIRLIARLLADQGIGPFDIGAVTRDHILIAVDGMKAAGNSARTINRRLNAVQSFYSFALDAAGLPDVKVVSRYSRPKMDTSAAHANATKALTAKELHRIYDSCGSARELLAVFLTVAVAGRADELCSADLRAVRVVGEEITITLSRKGGKVRTFELTPQVLELVELVHGDRTSGPLLLNSDGQAMTKGALDALLQRLGRRGAVWTCDRAYTRRKGKDGKMHVFDSCRSCRDVTPHVLRATQITRLAIDEKWPLHKVQRFADHASPATTEGYIARWHDRQTRAEGVKAASKGMDKYLSRFAR